MCAGIADRIDADAIAIRVFAVLLACVTFGVGVVAYVILWVRLPLEAEGPVLYDVLPEYAESSAYGVISSDGKPAACRSCAGREGAQSAPVFVRLAVAVALILLFLVVSTGISPFVPGTRWWQFWPVAFMIGGLLLVVFPIKSDFEIAWHAFGIVITSIFATMLPAALGMTPWPVLMHASMALWPLLALALVMFVVGIVMRDSRIVIAATLLVVTFCLLALYLFALPSAPYAMMRYFDGEMGVVHL